MKLDYFVFQSSIVHLYMNVLSVIFFLYLFVTLYKVHKCDVMLPANSLFNKTDHPVPVLLHSAPAVSRYQRSAFARKYFILKHEDITTKQLGTNISYLLCNSLW